MGYKSTGRKKSNLIEIIGELVFVVLSLTLPSDGPPVRTVTQCHTPNMGESWKSAWPAWTGGRLSVYDYVM